MHACVPVRLQSFSEPSSLPNLPWSAAHDQRLIFSPFMFVPGFAPPRLWRGTEGCRLVVLATGPSPRAGVALMPAKGWPL